MATSLILTVCGILFVAVLIRSVIGFGDGLIAMPIFVILLGIKTATPLIGLIAPTISFTILGSAWRQVNIWAAWRLILGAFMGIPVGLWALTSVPEDIVKFFLGLVLILFGGYSLFTPKLPSLPNERYALGFGFVAGILGGAYNTNGPPAVIYGSLRRWPPNQFRATMQAFFFPTGLMILAGQGLAGLWTRQVVTLYIFTLPFIFAAIWIGSRINGKIPAQQFGKIIYLFLLIIGLAMIIGV